MIIAMLLMVLALGLDHHTPRPRAHPPADALQSGQRRGDGEHAETVFRAASGAFFAVSVPDLRASVAWYSETLGLRTVMSTSGPNDGTVAVLEGNGLIVELVHLPSALPLARAAPAVRDKEYVHGFFKAGVIVDDFDALVARLKAGGVEIAYGPFPPRPGQRANVIIRDNAGNLIQFFGK